MTAPAKTLSELNKVVVAFLERAPIKGVRLQLILSEDSFHLLPPENPLQQHGTEVEFKNVEGCLLCGRLHRQPRTQTEPQARGRIAKTRSEDRSNLC